MHVARPGFDNVAIRFPGVKIVMAHLGHPFEGECVVWMRTEQRQLVCKEGTLGALFRWRRPGKYPERACRSKTRPSIG